jgi:hypothetical protein
MSKKARKVSEKISLIAGSLGLDCGRKDVLRIHKHNLPHYEKLVDKCAPFKSYYDDEITPISNFFILGGEGRVVPLTSTGGLLMLNSGIEGDNGSKDYDTNASINLYVVVTEGGEVTLPQYIVDKIPIIYDPTCTKKDAVRDIHKRKKSIKKILKRGAEDREDREDRKRMKSNDSDSEVEDPDYVYSTDDPDDSGTSVDDSS